MKVSVIIPTYNRRGPMSRALCSLQEQTLPEFEPIVVDNSKNAKLERIVTEFNRAARIPVRYVPEPQLGLHNARHAGARAATGDILVFADDDETFAPKWLSAYVRAFADYPDMVAAGGPIRLVWEAPPPKWLIDFMGQTKMFPILGLIDTSKEFRLDPKGHFFGGNMAIRRDVLFQVSGFNPDLIGDVYFGDGEVGLYQKLWERDVLIGYVPDALAYNHIPSQRMTVEYFCRRMANEGAGEMYTTFHKGIPRWPRLCKYAAGVIIGNYQSWITALFLRGRTDKRSVEIRMDTAKTQAQLRYIIRLMLSKDLRNLVLKKDWLNESCASALFQR